jgi:DNA-binding HxlR family transcriptional regulator
MDSNGPGSNGPDRAEERRVMARELLERIADKWTLLVIDALEEGDGDMRFGQIREKVGKISQKMLTRTLRQLERDGLVVRTVRPVIPPHVDYRLTPLGLSLAESVCGVWMWGGRPHDGRATGPARVRRVSASQRLAHRNAPRHSLVGPSWTGPRPPEA